MELVTAKKESWYSIKEIKGLNEPGDQLYSKLLAHGFIPGERIMIKRFAPIFKDPILVQVGNTQMAITKTEAQNIILKQLE